MSKVTIIGSGSFGTALAVVAARSGNEVKLWAREIEIVNGINKYHQNPDYLTDVTLPDTIECYNHLEECLHERDIIMFAVPSHALREVAQQVKPLLTGNEILVNVAKGIERHTFMTMSQVLADVFDGVILDDQIGVISGPSHAEEVAKFRPTTVVASSNSKRTARIIQETFMTPMFRIYLNHDITGVEIGGSVKNIMAIAAGIIEGADLGDNAMAAVITRGLHEMKRLGTKLGAAQDTFSGLSGMGDLVVTCSSRHSRNRSVGYQIGKGRKLQDVINEMSMVAEGVNTTKSVLEWSRKLNVEMPITGAVYRVLYENETPRDMLYDLMTRNPKDEIMI